MTTQFQMRKAALAQIADEVIAQQAQDEADRAAAREADARAAEQRRERMRVAAAAAEEWTRRASAFEGHIRAGLAELKSMLGNTTDLLHAPGSSLVSSKNAAILRCSRWLATELHAVAQQGDHFGTLKLNNGNRRPSGSSFAEGEASILAKLFAAQEEERSSNGDARTG